MKRIYSILLSVFLILGLVIGAGAGRAQAARQYDHVYDGANLLTSSQKSYLEELAVSASEEANADISIVTISIADKSLNRFFIRFTDDLCLTLF